MIKLPPKFKAKWVAALRSGKYVQGQNRLTRVVWSKSGKKIRKHCCLGVAGALCGTPSRLLVGGTLDTGMVPARVLKVFDQNTGRSSGTLQDNLAGMNDDKNRSFKYIASWIERWL